MAFTKHIFDSTEIFLVDTRMLTELLSINQKRVSVEKMMKSIRGRTIPRERDKISSHILESLCQHHAVADESAHLNVLLVSSAPLASIYDIRTKRLSEDPTTWPCLGTIERHPIPKARLLSVPCPVFPVYVMEKVTDGSVV